MKKYFSFIGYVQCREIKKDSVKKAEHIYNVAANRFHIDLFKVRGHYNLVLIIVSSVFCGEYGEKHYLALKDSFELNAAVPVNTFNEQLKQSLI